MDYKKKITIKNKVTKQAKRVTLFEALSMEDENWIIASKKALKQRERNKDFSRAIAANWTSVVEEHSVNNKVLNSTKTKSLSVTKLKMNDWRFGTAISKQPKRSSNNSKTTRGRYRQIVTVFKEIEINGVRHTVPTNKVRVILHTR